MLRAEARRSQQQGSQPRSREAVEGTQYQGYWQEAIFMPVVNLVSLNLVSDSLRGFQVMPNAFVRMEQVWVQR